MYTYVCVCAYIYCMYSKFPTFCLCIPSYDKILNVFFSKSRLTAPDKVLCVCERIFPWGYLV